MLRIALVIVTGAVVMSAVAAVRVALVVHVVGRASVVLKDARRYGSATAECHRTRGSKHRQNIDQRQGESCPEPSGFGEMTHHLLKGILVTTVTHVTLAWAIRQA